MIKMAYLAQEQLRVLCLDTKNHVIAQQTVYQGTVNSSAVRVAEVFRPAISRTCPSVIVAHTPPSGDPTPSPEDLRTTEQLRKAGESLDIELLDHTVNGRNQMVAFAKAKRVGSNPPGRRTRALRVRRPGACYPVTC